MSVFPLMPSTPLAALGLRLALWAARVLLPILIVLWLFAAPAHARAQNAPNPTATGATSTETTLVPAEKGHSAWTVPAATLVGAAAGGGAGLLTGVVIGLVRAGQGSCAELAGCPVLAAAAYGSKGLGIGTIIGLVGGLILGLALVVPPSPAQPQPAEPQPQLPTEVARRSFADGCQTTVAFSFDRDARVRVRPATLVTIRPRSSKLRALHKEVHADGESITSGVGQARGALAG
jgi:hypothetical protein